MVKHSCVGEMLDVRECHLSRLFHKIHCGAVSIEKDKYLTLLTF